jgi:DNA-binding NtrC family response regulator
MMKSDMLLIAPASQERDSFELLFRRRGMNVFIAETCRDGRALLSRIHLRAVLVAHIAGDPHLNKFLLTIREHHPGVPIFLTGNWEPRKLMSLVNQRLVMLLPPGVTADALEQFLFSAAAAEAAPEPAASRLKRKRLLVLGREFSVRYRAARAEFEAEFITRALEHERGNVSQTARLVGMTRRNLQIKIQQYRIDLQRILSETAELAPG